MNKKTVSRKISIVIAMLSFAEVSNAERYSVEEDSFGNVVADKVVADKVDIERPLNDKGITAERKINQPLNNTATSPDSAGISPSSVEESKVPNLKRSTDDVQSIGDAKDESQVVGETTAAKTDSSQKESVDPIIGDTGKRISSFERAFIESEKERLSVLEGIRNAPQIEEYDATKVNPIEFIDGDDLEAGKGTLVKPYYTVVDENGRYKNIFYDPEDLDATLTELRKHKVKLTPATVLSKDTKEANLPKNAELKAVQILLGNREPNNFFERFTQFCCAQIPNVEAKPLELGKSRYTVIDQELLPYRFSEGDTRYALFQLPDIKEVEEFDIAVRSFIKTFKNEGVQNGVFYPQMVTLDAKRQPMRIFSDMLLTYHEETWSSHGYLEGFFRIKDTLLEDEKFLLVYTSKRLLKQDTVIERDNKADFVINNMNIGSVEIEVLAQND